MNDIFHYHCKNQRSDHRKLFVSTALLSFIYLNPLWSSEFANFLEPRSGFSLLVMQLAHG